MTGRMTKIAGLSAAAMSLALNGAAAGEMRSTGTYIGAAGGLSIARDTEFSGSGINVDGEHDNGWVGVVNLGHAYANGLRGEIEAGNHRNAFDKVGGATAGGRSRVYSGMVNGYYDFATGTGWVPYIGAGIGAGHVNVATSPIGGSTVADNDTALALQGMAGFGFKFDNNWTGTLEYRYFQTFGANVQTAAGTNIDADYAAHSIMVGLRYTFGEPAKKPMAEPAPAPAPKPVAQAAPAPQSAPPPPPKPAVARNYIVFFDWDKSTLTPEALAILKSAADNAKMGGISRIEATGHADRSGTDKYNMKLSEKRARAVQAELARLGIPTGQVGVAWKGEREPLVQTPDGVREPQNRRVEIVFP